MRSRRGLEAWIWGALSLARLKRSGKPFPVVAETGGDAERVLIGPANSAGQGYNWARALERARAGTRVTSMQFVQDNDHFAFPIDQGVPSGYGAHSTKWQRAQRRALLAYHAVVVESALPILGGRHGSNVPSQVAELRASGTHVALLFHGSDLRDPDAHLAAEPLSYFAEDTDFTRTMRDRTRRSRDVIAATGAPVFVSTPDLLSEVEGARWLPVVVDWKGWSACSATLLDDSRVPIVVHAPSSSFIKGTELVEPVLLRLHDAGVIDYREVSGVPHSEMRALVQRADIVVDQFRGGPYGVAACEAMAAGRVVVSHVSDVVRAQTLLQSGMELPVVEAIPDTLEEVLRGIIVDREAAETIGRRGREFAKHWHDGRQSGQVLSKWLSEDPQSETKVGKRVGQV